MPSVRVLITGSSGLIGSEAVEYFGQRGHACTACDADKVGADPILLAAGQRAGATHAAHHLVQNEQNERLQSSRTRRP